MNTHKHLPLNIDVVKLLAMCDGIKQIDEQKQADYMARNDKVNARRRERYAANREQCRAKLRKYYSEHRDEINARQRQRRVEKMNNPEYAEKQLEQSRKYRAEHRDKINEYKRAWRARKKAAKAAQDKEQCKDN